MSAVVPLVHSQHRPAVRGPPGGARGTPVRLSDRLAQPLESAAPSRRRCAECHLLQGDETHSGSGPLAPGRGCPSCEPTGASSAPVPALRASVTTCRSVCSADAIGHASQPLGRFHWPSKRLYSVVRYRMFNNTLRPEGVSATANTWPSASCPLGSRSNFRLSAT